jgi:hypothetical protein
MGQSAMVHQVLGKRVRQEERAGGVRLRGPGSDLSSATQNVTSGSSLIPQVCYSHTFTIHTKGIMTSAAGHP